MEKFNDKEALKKFGANLRQIRNSKGMKLEDVSAHSGIDTSDIGKIERGEINIAFSTLCKLAIGLDIRLSKLVDFDF
ncbi:helix-turn-helix domain-containing protein [Chitinophaga barathri]|uniref:XRE family transcriptional regulator n=1 Tax=Chitinophaga barathri TaxID=1647451 RepID=A0A3N4M802_9BACT|nr:helix-turn-helix transcriptional regulator [Chitinophaga barathri]RPD39458.1 XRE family transcriptional regulator [Chitinophaga barathri]